MSERKSLEQVLIATEVIADVVAKQHDECCDIGAIARVIRKEAREARESMAAGNGPAQVATDEYRRNYDTIFGKRPFGQA